VAGDNNSLRDTYFGLIDRIVSITLEGKIRSKSQVYRFLAEGITPGTGEIFEQCLTERMTETQTQIPAKMKATRILKALETVKSEWENYQKANQQNARKNTVVDQLINAGREERILFMSRLVDCNHPQSLTPDELTGLAASLQQVAQLRGEADLFQLATGIKQGLNSWQLLSTDLLGWLERKESLGFANEDDAPNPWLYWAKKLSSSGLQRLLKAIGEQKSLEPIIEEFTLTDWVEMTLVLTYVQKGAIEFFDRRVYVEKFSANLSISTFLTFSIIWILLTISYDNIKRLSIYTQGCFEVMLQILKNFTKRDYYPLYGGVFVAFSGKQFLNTMSVLNFPLQRLEGTAEQGRILTLLGYSSRIRNDYKGAIVLHYQALESARKMGDFTCEIANLNHLSRIYALGKQWEDAINLSQRALILSRQHGDLLGQANALANLGYSEVLQAEQLEQMDSDDYERSMNYLDQGLKLAERLNDPQSKALIYSSSGIAQVILQRPAEAIESFRKGLKCGREYGDIYIQGLILVYLAEAYNQTGELSKTIYTAYIAMYWLYEIGASEWRQAASLITILYGRNPDDFTKALEGEKAAIIDIINQDGFMSIKDILSKYNNDR
jgi:tetratricopeptide (TPR) repeat protein